MTSRRRPPGGGPTTPLPAPLRLGEAAPHTILLTGRDGVIEAGLAHWRQAANPAANSCSGLVAPPGPPSSFGVASSTSRMPSSERARPLRPPSAVAIAVYRAFIKELLIAGLAAGIVGLQPRSGRS